MKLISFSILSYLIGSIPFALLIGKFFRNIDIRNYGSGNLGTTNGLRVLGKKLAGLIFICDLSKGILTTMLGGYLFGDIGMIIGLIASVLGHIYPIFAKFKGGKGVATSIGGLLVINPVLTILLFFTGLLIAGLTRYVSLASISISIIAPLLFFFKNDSDMSVNYGIIFLGALVLYKHRDNIKRLVKGEENRF